MGLNSIEGVVSALVKHSSIWTNKVVYDVYDVVEYLLASWSIHIRLLNPIQLNPRALMCESPCAEIFRSVLSC